MENTFTDFQSNLNQSGDVFEVNDDYKYNNTSDTKSGILIERNNFVISGNNHILDGNNQSRIFNITCKNITICNLVFVSGKTIKFELNGKTTKTNSKGLAKVTVKKNDIGKLKKGKTYTVKVAYLKDTIKTTVKVK